MALFAHCVRTQNIDIGQERGILNTKMAHLFGTSGKSAYLCSTKKVNRLFRLVVIDLGF